MHSHSVPSSLRSVCLHTEPKYSPSVSSCPYRSYLPFPYSPLVPSFPPFLCIPLWCLRLLTVSMHFPSDPSTSYRSYALSFRAFVCLPVFSFSPLPFLTDPLFSHSVPLSPYRSYVFPLHPFVPLPFPYSPLVPSSLPFLCIPPWCFRLLTVPMYSR